MQRAEHGKSSAGGTGQYDSGTELASIRAERGRQQHESQMLRLALEELVEEAEKSRSAEKTAMHTIAVKEEELLRCLIQCAVRSGDTRTTAETTDGARDAHASPGSSPAASVITETEERLLEVLKTYRDAQETISHEMHQEMETSRSMALALRKEQRHNAAAEEARAPAGAYAASIACEVELLHEMTAEANRETDAMLLEYGSALFT